MSNQYDIVIVGGGLAGLSAAIHLSKGGLNVCLIEKNEFPKHKVCGEYISNEVTPYLNWLGLDPFEHGGTSISKFELSTRSGKKISTTLPLGGFGISRYRLDHLLSKRAKKAGCTIIQETVNEIEFINDSFKIHTKGSERLTAEFVIGAFGKRSNLDNSLNRDFFKSPAPYLGVKAHYKGEFDPKLVALHNFEGGYCGVSKVENDLINICYLADFKSFKQHKNLKAFEKHVLFENPHLKSILTNCEMVFDAPLTISQVSFLPKKSVHNHILMTGDAAGMIHPLCGNGMGMAIHSAFMLSELIFEFKNGQIESRTVLEKKYQQQWDRVFWKRLQAGRIFNRFFRNNKVFESGLRALTSFPSLLPTLIRQTHGEPIPVPMQKQLTV